MRGKIYGLLQLTMPLGYLLGMVAALLLSDTLGWRGVFYITGGLGMLLAALIFFGVRDVPRGISESDLADLAEIGVYRFDRKVALGLFRKPSLRLLWVQGLTPTRFTRFVERAIDALGDLCQLWCTIDEPLMYAAQGYLLGNFPPGKADIASTFRVAAAMLRGHTMAATVLHRADPALRVGLTHYLRIFDPATPALQDVAVAMAQDTLFNGLLLHVLRTGRALPPLGRGTVSDELLASCDFFGLNYYSRDRIAFDLRYLCELFGRRFTPPGVPQSEHTREGTPYGEIYPGRMERVLRRVARLRLPIYITETGLPDADDDQRPGFLLSHLAAIHRAIAAGVDVRGIFLWTLVDNFEWADGWGLRFGLYVLDERTQQRTLRRSGALYAAIARANAIPGNT